MTPSFPVPAQQWRREVERWRLSRELASTSSFVSGYRLTMQGKDAGGEPTRYCVSNLKGWENGHP